MGNPLLRHNRTKICAMSLPYDSPAHPMDTLSPNLPQPSRAVCRSGSPIANDVAPRVPGSHGSGFRAAMARIVFGSNQDPKQILRLRRYFAAAGTSLLAIGLLFASRVQGVISSATVLQIAAAILLAIPVFYTVFYFGLNLELSDPSLTEPQMLTATVVDLCAMYSANSGRGAFLILLLMAYLFGVLHLKTRALLVYAL